MKPLLLLRPEPGLAASAARARALGLEVLTCPLFAVQPIAWRAPDPAGFDALLLTSANAVRHAGKELDTLRGLPVHAVGAATAEAARAAGLRVASVGEGSAEDLRATLGDIRLLHLCGFDHHDVAGTTAIAVYRAAAVERPDLPPLAGLVVAVHSPRAGQRLAELARARGATAIAAISAPAAEACGGGWQQVVTAEAPSDGALLALAARLCQGSGE